MISARSTATPGYIRVAFDRLHFRKAATAQNASNCDRGGDLRDQKWSQTFKVVHLGELTTVARGEFEQCFPFLSLPALGPCRTSYRGVNWFSVDSAA